MCCVVKATLNRRTFLEAAAMAVLFANDPAPAVADIRRYRPSGVQPVSELTVLPATDSRLALTVDDGVSVEVVAAYADFCHNTGTRVTFFVNGVHESWTANAPQLRPMIESGQIQVANHSWSHPDFTTISADELVEQISRNADFLKNTFGVDGRPYLRPPYGHHNSETDRIAAELGYPNITLWSSSIEDSSLLTESELIANAEKCFEPGQIVLAHANLPPVTHCYPQMMDIIASRGLHTVTLQDAFG
jgi:peptidoglycan-N-acetylglucosamine deacetylase